MSAQHTPAPWVARFIEGGYRRRQRHQIETTTHGSKGLVAVIWAGSAEDEANARLIAAAPDLLALVRRCAEECAACGGDGWIETAIEHVGNDEEFPTHEPCADCAELRAVIAKAEGAR